MLTPELETVLQSFLIRKTEEWNQYVKEYPELALTSVHIAPDASWISLEHEEHEQLNDYGNYSGNGPTIIRKPASCHQIITKI